MNEVFEIKGKPAGMTFEHFTGYLASTTHSKRVMTLNEMANVAAFVAFRRGEWTDGNDCQFDNGQLGRLRAIARSGRMVG